MSKWEKNDARPELDTGGATGKRGDRYEALEYGILEGDVFSRPEGVVAKLLGKPTTSRKNEESGMPSGYWPAPWTPNLIDMFIFSHERDPGAGLYTKAFVVSRGAEVGPTLVAHRRMQAGLAHRLHRTRNANL